MQFFFFLLFGPLLFSNLLTFSFIVHFKRFKVLKEHHLQFSHGEFFKNKNKNPVLKHSITLLEWGIPAASFPWLHLGWLLT
jgi:hypothetical protein